MLNQTEANDRYGYKIIIFVVTSTLKVSNLKRTAKRIRLWSIFEIENPGSSVKTVNTAMVGSARSPTHRPRSGDAKLISRGEIERGMPQI